MENQIIITQGDKKIALDGSDHMTITFPDGSKISFSPIHLKEMSNDFLYKHGEVHVIDTNNPNTQK